MEPRNAGRMSILALLLIVLALGPWVECLSNSTDNKNHSSGHRNRTKSHPRIALGRKETSPPPWLGTLWHQPGKKSKAFQSDERFVGHAVSLGPKHFLADSTAMQHLDPLMNDKSNSEPEMKHLVLSPAAFNIKDGIYFNGTEAHTFHDRGGVVGNVHVYERIPSNSNPWATYIHPDPSHFPVLETNSSEYGKDCRIYGWGSKRSFYNDLSDDRHFQSSGVQVEGGASCKNGRCPMTTRGFDRAEICSRPTDHGAPVLCGPEKKLTYLVGHALGSSKEILKKGCTLHFEGYHVPSFHDLIVNGMKSEDE